MSALSDARALDGERRLGGCRRRRRAANRRRPGRLIVVGCLCAQLAGCTQVRTQPAIEGLPSRPLGFHGTLVDSDPSRLPPRLASTVTDSSALKLRYSEQTKDAHYTVPVWLGLVASPMILLGAPLGKYSVIARADLTITDNDGRELGQYHAQADVSRWYGLYYSSTYRELAHQARQAVRTVIDEAVSRDATRLRETAASEHE